MNKTPADLEREEDRLRSEAAALPDAQRREFYQRSRQRVRDPDTYAALNWFFVTGLHHYYLGRWIRGSINLFGTIAALVMIADGSAAAGVLLLLVIGVVELFELFFSQRTVWAHNNRVLQRTLAEVRGDRGDTRPPAAGQ